MEVYNALPVLLIADKYFMGVTCFLLFNVFAMFGSLLAAVSELVILFVELSFFFENCYFSSSTKICVSENVFEKITNILFYFAGSIG